MVKNGKEYKNLRSPQGSSPARLTSISKDLRQVEEPAVFIYDKHLNLNT